MIADECVRAVAHARVHGYALVQYLRHKFDKGDVFLFKNHENLNLMTKLYGTIDYLTP